MALPPQFDQPAGDLTKRIDTAIDIGQAKLFRVLWFALPPQSIARNLGFQALLVSRFLSDIALQALLFAALINSAQNQGDEGDAALIGICFLLPGLVLGLWGGAVADALPKRLVLTIAYLLMGSICFILPISFGVNSTSLLMVLLLVRVLHQITQPAEASAAPLVANDEELASANSFLSLSSSAGEVLGKAILAPIFISVWGLNSVTLMAGILFLLSSLRITRFTPNSDVVLNKRNDANQRKKPEQSTEATSRSMQFSTHQKYTSLDAVRWLFSEKDTLLMLLLAAMASTVGVVLTILGPKYVISALGVPPEYAFYVFAPASLGVIAGMLIAPKLIHAFSENSVGMLGFLLVALGVSSLGQIEAANNLAQLFLIVDIPRINDQTETAGALSLFIGLGITLAAAATPTYIGKFVPIVIHGRIFALLGVLKDGLAIPQLIAIGILANFIGVENVLTFAPIAILVVAGTLLFITRQNRFRKNN
ncbi:MAG TPA: MFS transporter [Dehalococcoidia bacterium]|nr:MFS transporter [Dehalococcoidia bacterium]